MRCVFRFGKLDRLRFVSHLDLQRYMQRALNRSGLPVAFSQGFNPHPVMSFASALAMGWESEYEVLDIKFTKHVPERERLRACAARCRRKCRCIPCATWTTGIPA